MANLGKILAIDSDFAFRTILSSEFSPIVSNPCSFKIEIRCNSVFLFGYYVKYSRYLSQTPWMVNGNKLAESSIQE
jgi:tRNA U54 and U55 pseudouridine synthase Pus10